jgi:hypothetical protein
MNASMRCRSDKDSGAAGMRFGRTDSAAVKRSLAAAAGQVKDAAQHAACGLDS